MSLRKSATGNSCKTQDNCFAVNWLHGTTRYFEKWRQPPIPPTNPRFIPHSFVCLSAGIKYPNLHKGTQGGICSARLLSQLQQNVLDLRKRTKESLLLREKILETNLGATNSNGIKTPEGWFKACNNGLVLRYVINNKNNHKELFEKLKIASSASKDRIVRLEADAYVHNFNRSWTELVIGMARSMGYVAVICDEQGRELGDEASTQLFVFNTDILSPPIWLEYPHAANLTNSNSFSMAKINNFTQKLNKGQNRDTVTD